MTKACAFYLVLLASPASALWFNGGMKQTAGSGGYRGTSLNMTVGQESYSFRPSYTMYESDGSAGVFRSVAGRAGYDTKVFGFGFTGGGTNEVDGYKNRYGEVDATFSLTPGGQGAEKRIDGRGDSSGPARGAGLVRVDIGGAFRYTRHYDRFEARPGTRNKLALRNNGKVFEVDQRDYTGSVGVSVLGNLASVDYTKSDYSRDITANNARGASFMRLRGIGPVVQGFPDSSVTGRLETSMFPFVTPFAQYTRTRFVVGLPDSHDATVGASVELGIVEITASYENYSQRGFGAQDYFSAGAGMRF